MTQKVFILPEPVEGREEGIGSKSKPRHYLFTPAIKQKPSPLEKIYLLLFPLKMPEIKLTAPKVWECCNPRMVEG